MNRCDNIMLSEASRISVGTESSLAALPNLSGAIFPTTAGLAAVVPAVPAVPAVAAVAAVAAAAAAAVVVEEVEEEEEEEEELEAGVIFFSTLTSDLIFKTFAGGLVSSCGLDLARFPGIRVV